MKVVVECGCESDRVGSEAARHDGAQRRAQGRTPEVEIHSALARRRTTAGTYPKAGDARACVSVLNSKDCCLF